MAAKKNPDHIPLHVVSSVTVSEAQWRRWCESRGVSLAGVSVPAHVAGEIKTLVMDALRARGVLVEN